MQSNSFQQNLTNKHNVLSGEELEAKHVIRELRLWKILFKKYWYWFIFSAIVGGSIGFIYADSDIPLYTAKTRFMLKNEGVGSLFGSQMSTLTGLLGGGQMGSPLERTAEVIASDRIVGKALLQEATIGGKTDLIINHFMRLSSVKKSWSRDTMLKNINFKRNDNDINELSIGQRKAFKLVKNMMVPEKETGVVRKAFDKKSGVLSLSCVHSDETFAIALSKAIYNELNNFFVEQMTYNSMNNAEVMKRKVDSIQLKLNTIRRAFAEKTDQSLGLLLQQDKVDLKALFVKEQMLSVMYAEAVKNYESFQFMNSATMPSLTLIDAPYAPLTPVQKSKKIYLLFFSFLFVSVIFLFFRTREILYNIKSI